MKKKSFFRKVIELSNSLETRYLDDIRMRESDFTRHRKITLSHLYLQMFGNKGKSQKNEIDDFYKDIKSPVKVSQTAFYNARMKFNPEALLKMMQDLMQETYETDDFLLTLNGYFVCAIDGSDFILPSTSSNKEIYGAAENASVTEVVMASVSSAFDCINKLFLDIKINPYKYSEHITATEHLKKVKEIVPRDSKMLCIFDRGYPSIRIIDQMIDDGQKFLIRLKSSDFKKELAQLVNETDDRWIDVIYDSARTNAFRKDFRFRQKLLNTIYHLRFVKIPLTKSDGEKEIEYLVTNLDDMEFDTTALEELYHVRWDIESCYRSLKSQFKIEEFSGNRDILIRQDIYASAFVYNTISMTIAENEKVKKAPEERYRYEMKVNRNYAIGVMKRDFLEMFVLYRDKKAAEAARKRFEEQIVKHACPVRKHRRYRRNKPAVNKSKIAYRKSF